MALFGFLDGKKRRHELGQKLARDARRYVREVKRTEALPTVPTSLLLKKNEHAFLEEPTTLSETRSVRNYSGGATGAGFRLAKGLYIGGGSRSGTSESHEEWRTIDEGTVLITNQRLVFRGTKENRNFPIAKLMSVEPLYDAIVVSSETRKKTMLFKVENSFIWVTVVHILTSCDDPLNIGEITGEPRFEFE